MGTKKKQGGAGAASETASGESGDEAPTGDRIQELRRELLEEFGANQTEQAAALGFKVQSSIAHLRRRAPQGLEPLCLLALERLPKATRARVLAEAAEELRALRAAVAE